MQLIYASRHLDVSLQAEWHVRDESTPSAARRYSYKTATSNDHTVSTGCLLGKNRKKILTFVTKCR